MPNRSSEYKPLLYTTTDRNPERIKNNLFILKKFENKILTNELAIQIVMELIRYGLYRPMNVSDYVRSIWIQNQGGEFAVSLLTYDEIKKIVKNNPQQHKEAGFDKGYPSRFATIFDLAKELGFVYFKINEKIEFSELGNILADIIDLKIDESGNISIDTKQPEREQSVFLQSLARSQRRNPFVRVLNDNIPLLLLLEVIKLLNSDTECGNSTGITRQEIPLLLFWKNQDSKALYLRIKELRKTYGYSPSDEVIIDICINEIMEGNYKKFDTNSIMVDYVDEFIRKMRMSGLISIRGAGRFIDINHNEEKKINYILTNYSKYHLYDNEYEYFKYMSSIDKNLISLKSDYVSEEKANILLSEWLKLYDWEQIKKELHILSTRKISKDNILKFLSAPIRLEFLTALAIKSRMPNVVVKPNYSCDDTGLPTSTAGGNRGDIECYEGDRGILVEVTMSEGRTQTMMEIWPIERHLRSFIDQHRFDAQCIFTAPSIFHDSMRQIDFVKDRYNLTIRAYSIDDFSMYLEEEKTLYC